jgi:branched-chain amino acid transport system ATP-binding protein
MLRIEQVSRAFGGVFANRDVSMTVARGELRGVIGPNGAGKSTLFGLISGHLRSQSGSIWLDDSRIDQLPPHRRARQGIGVVFQGARLFGAMTVIENVMVGAHAWTRRGPWSAALRIPLQRREEREIFDEAWAALERVGLSDWAHRDAQSLPLGQQRRVQVARALAGRPRVLLLDEPASGLREQERADLADLIEQLRDEGMTTLLIEHDIAFVTRLSDRITVLDLGSVIAEGTPAEILKNPAVVTAYLGTEGVDA